MRATPPRSLAAAVLAAALLPPSIADGEPRPRALPVDSGTFAGTQIYGSTDDPSPASSIALGLRAGYALDRRLTLESELAFLPSQLRGTDAGVLVLGWRAHAVLHVLRRGPWIPFVAGGLGGVTSWLADPDARNPEVRVALRSGDTDFLIDAGAGVKYALGRRIGLRLDARGLFERDLDDGFPVARFEALIGAYALLPDRRPPAPPRPPPPPPDPDGDGVLAADDWCPEEAEDADGWHDDDGCPEPDNDGDAIADAEDRCPDEPELVNEVDDEDGCPETDADGDGLFGSRDACPEQAEDADGHEDEDGCPETDNDGDLLADDADACPTEIEIFNGVDDGDGCPDTIPDELQRILGPQKRVRFARGRHKLDRRSAKALAPVAAALAAHPGVRISIDGYCAEKGKRWDDVALAAARAATIKKHLVEKGGVAAERIDAAGHTIEPEAAPPRGRGRARRRRPPPSRIEISIVIVRPQAAPAAPPDGAPPADDAPPDGSSPVEAPPAGSPPAGQPPAEPPPAEPPPAGPPPAEPPPVEAAPTI